MVRGQQSSRGLLNKCTASCNKHIYIFAAERGDCRIAECIATAGKGGLIVELSRICFAIPAFAGLYPTRTSCHVHLQYILHTRTSIKGLGAPLLQPAVLVVDAAARPASAS